MLAATTMLRVMDITLFGASALSARRHARTTGRYSLAPTERNDVSTPRLREISPKGRTYLERFSADGVLHLRMPRPADRPRAPKVCGHVTTCALVPGSFERLMPVPGSKEERFFQQEQLRLYVDAPALQLCWFARDLSRRNGWEGSRQAVRRVAVLAMELMGTYSLGPDPSIEAGEAYGLAQLTTKDALAQQLGELSNIDGLVLARKAVARAGEKAASPLEALFFLYLTLPPRLGGLGISHVLLNHPLDVDELRRVGAAHTMLTPDLWLQDLGIVIECDSRLSHDTGAFAVAHAEAAAVDRREGRNMLRDPFREDRQRAQDCAAANLLPMSVTAEDCASVEALIAFGRRLCHAADARNATDKYVKKIERFARNPEWRSNVRGLLEAFALGGVY